MKLCYLADNFSRQYGNGRIAIKIFEVAKKNIRDFSAIFLVTKTSGEFDEMPLIYPNKYKLLLSYCKIRSIIKKSDLVHAIDGFPFGVIAALACLGTKKKFIITGIGSGAIQMLDRKLYGWLLKWAYKRASAVTVISRYIAGEIEKKIPNLKVRVINPGIDFDEYKLIDLNKQLSMNLEAKKPYILTVAMIKKRKGFHTAIPAFAKVAEKFPNLHYLVVGSPLETADEIYQKELVNLAAKLNVQDKVHFIGFVKDRSELYAIYRNAELFCLLPQDIGRDVEGFGLVLLEAAVNGLPVVVGRGSGADDAVLDGKNGYSVDSYDADSVSEAILKIIQNINLKNQFKKESVNFASEMDWDKVGLKYVELYKTIIN